MICWLSWQFLDLLSKELHKDEIISRVPDSQGKFDFEQFRSDLSITKLVNTNLKEKVIGLEQQTWINGQYSWRECLKLRGIPETVENKNLEGTVLGNFEKLDLMVDWSNAKNYHWIKSSKAPKKVIVKLSRRKDANKTRLSKKRLKGMSLSSLDINSTVCIQRYLMYLSQNVVG